MNYSHTRISTFESCPLKYRYQYVERLTATLGDTIEAFLGRRVHEALEKLYRDLQMTRLLTLQELIAGYEENWEKKWEDTIRLIRKEYEPQDYMKKGCKCLEDYYRRYQPFDRGRTVGIEKKVDVDLGEGRRLSGIIDRLVLLDGGSYEIHDYKTSGYLPTQAEADRDRQLALYQLGVQAMWEDVSEVELVWHYLVFDAEIRSRRTRQDLEKLKQEVNTLIDTIENAEEFPPRPGPLCDWCEFRNVCPEWKHLYRLEELPRAEFKEDDGLKLVDRYAEVLREEEELKAEKDELKKALSDYCAAFGYEVVYGTDRKIRVKRLKTFQFPSSHQAARQKLEKLLRESGSWDDFSSLSLNKLESALRKGALPETLAARLKPFYTEEESIRLYSSRIKSEEK